MCKNPLNFLFSEIEIKVGLTNESLEGTVTLQVFKLYSLEKKFCCEGYF